MGLRDYIKRKKDQVVGAYSNDASALGIAKNTVKGIADGSTLRDAKKFDLGANSNTLGGRIGGTVASGLLNPFINVKDYAIEAADQYYGNKPANTKVLVGKGLGASLDLAGMYGGAKAASSVANEGKKWVAGQVPSLTRRIKDFAGPAMKVGGGYGLGYGTSQAMADDKSGKDIALEGVKGAGIGAIAGPVLAGGSAALGALPKVLRNSIGNRIPGAITKETIPAHYVKSNETAKYNPVTNRAYPKPGYRTAGTSFDDGFNGRVSPVDKLLPEQVVERGRRKPTLSDLGREVVDALPRPGMNIQAIDDPLLQEARKYKSAEEFVNSFEKRFHQTSPEIAQSIEKNGFTANRGAASAGDVMPQGINTKSHPNEIGIPNKGTQVEIAFGKGSKTLDFENRDAVKSYLSSHKDGSKYYQITSKMKELDGYYSKKLNELEKQQELFINDSKKYESFFNKQDELLAEWKKTVDDLGDEAAQEATRIFKQDGISAINIKKDTGGAFGNKSTDNTIIFDPSQIKTKSQLTDLWNKSQGSPKTLKDLGKELVDALPRPGMSIQDVSGGKYNPASVQEGIANVKAKQRAITPVSAQEAKNAGLGAKYMAEANKLAFDQSFNKWIADKEIARTKGYQVGSKVKIPEGEEWNVVKAIEGTGETKATETVKQLQDEFDTAYKEAKDFGIDIGYLKNYITHVWEQSPQDVAQAYKVFSQKFKWAKHRTLPTYDEGIEMGLTPKYNNPRQILAHYVEKLNETKANINFLKDLKDKGLIVDASAGRMTPGLVPLNAPGMLRSTSRIDGETAVIGNYYADPKIAETINRVFDSTEKGTLGNILEKTAIASRTLQDLSMSGGIPKTPINAFTIAQMTKEILAGRLKSPLGSFFRSMSGEATEKFYKENLPTIQKMQERNVPINTTLDIESLGESSFIQKAFTGSKPGKWEGVKSVWNKAMNEPTFKRFMGQLQVNLFNDIEQKALQSGKTAQEAADVAGNAVNNFYGLVGTGKRAMRDPNLENTASTFLFAPRYREAMVNFWVNNLKALGHPLKLENRTNMAFNVGALALFAAYDYMNQELNGHHLWENPKGKEDKLLVPNGKTTVGIPYLSSIATVPRALYREGKMLVEGDISGAAKDALQTYSSSMIKPVADVLNNSDYFGNEITRDIDTAKEKFKKVGGYLAKQYTGHPYVKTAIDAATGDKPGLQLASQALELPFRFYKTESIQNAPFWEEYQKQKQVNEIKKQMKYGKIGVDEGSEKIEELSSEMKTPVGEIKRIKSANGDYFAFKTSQGIDFAQTEEEAKIKLEKNRLKQSDEEKVSKVGDKYLVEYPSGRTYTMNEEQYQKYQAKQSVSSGVKKSAKEKTGTRKTTSKTTSAKKTKKMSIPSVSDADFIVKKMVSRLRPLRAFGSRRTNLASVRRPRITRKKIRAYA